MEAKGDGVFRVFYGTPNVRMDVTFDTLLRCCQGTMIEIPASNGEQDALFSDPLFGVVKQISIQENDQTRVFEPQQLVRYTCQLNGELLRYASLLRPDQDNGVDFAMQLVTAMYAQSDGFLLKIGAKFGVPQIVFASNNIRATVLDADYNCASTLGRKLVPRSTVTVRPCALSFQPVILTGSHLESLDAVQSASDPQHNNTVRLHSGPIDVMELEHKSTNTINISLPSLMGGDEIGIQRRTLTDLEDVQKYAFDTFVFDSQRSLDFLLRQAAPMLLCNVKTVIVGIQVPKHRAFGNYVQTQMDLFGFRMHKTFVYRNSFEIVVWRRYMRPKMLR